VRSRIPIAWVLLLLAWVLVDAGVGRAHAQGSSEALHGWVIVPVEREDENDRYALVHIPPRRPVAIGDGRFLRAEPGEIRLVSPLRRAPDWMAASGRRGYLFFHEGRTEVEGETAPLAEGLSVTAMPSSLGDAWSTDAAGRLTSAPRLPESTEVIALAGIDLGARSSVVLLGRSGDDLSLQVLDGTSWERLALPAELGPDAEPTLVLGGGLTLIDRTSGVRWEGDVTPGRIETRRRAPGRPYEPSTRVPPSVEWKRDARLVGHAIGGGTLLGLGREVVEIRERDGGLSLQLLSETSPIEIASVEGRAVDWAVVGKRGAFRVVVLLREESDGEAQEVRSRDPRASLRVVELSPYTGEVWYDGGVQSAAPVSPGEFRLLALVILGVMVFALLFVLRPDGETGVAPLPPETSLCDPGRRMAAGAADVLLALLGGSVLSGLISGEAAIALENPGALLLSAGVFFVHGALGEWLVGRTIGKSLMGCIVVSSSAKDAREGSWSLSLTQAVVRNLFKVVLPPIALLGVGDRARRHRGDVLARTSVVQPIPPDPGDPTE
jgi:hypothetical protein